MEVELEELVISIFSEPPGEPRSRTIAFDTSNLRQLFESLLIIFTNGMKLLFGDSRGVVELENLSEENIHLVQEYYESMGFRFYFDVYEDSNENRDKTQQMKYTNLTLTSSSSLKELYFPLLSRDRIYLINFDYI
jgi:hypothetical protein|tara:strand:- start:32 stop:436 length:405 start_codon:yes stop_codon:yes gene_type:complete